MKHAKMFPHNSLILLKAYGQLLKLCQPPNLAGRPCFELDKIPLWENSHVFC